MVATRFAVVLATTLAFCTAVTTVAAQQSQQGAATVYNPSVGQPGKDVVWVPTPQVLVDTMLDMAKVTASDRVIDLGSGDGRTVITAAKRGAQALGIEYNPELVELARRSAEREGVADRARFVKQDLYESDLSDATVITMFLLSEINLKLRPKLLGLKPGTRIVSNTFTMGEWEPDQTTTVDRNAGCETAWCTALYWVVPAQVGGRHDTSRGELTLEQTFQMLSGTLTAAGTTSPVAGKILGNEILLKIDGQPLRGTVNGRRIEFQ
jgi:precorrin-6B methylase 2